MGRDKMFDLERIRIDGGTQSRLHLDESVVAEYGEAMRAGDEFPPVVIFHDGTDHWLADGFHRFFGAKKAGLTRVSGQVIHGTKRDAILYSVGANTQHGLRRTNADKRKAVETLLADGEWAQWSDREIARQCGVTHPFVAAVRDPQAAARQQENRSRSTPKVVESDSTPEAGSCLVESDSTLASQAAPAEAVLPGAKGQESVPVPPADSAPEASAVAPSPRAKRSSTVEAGQADELRDRLEQIEDALAAHEARNAELEAENKALKMAADPDVLIRVQEIRQYARTVEQSRDHYMNENAELKKEVKKLQRVLARRQGGSA